MKLYPYSYPIILNDQIFTQFGGYTGTTLAVQRTAAYLIAEQQMTNYLDTPLLPTMFTSTAYFQYGNQFLVTDYGYVSKLLWVKVFNHKNELLKEFSGTYYDWAAVRNDTYGYLYVQDCLDGCCGNCTWGYDLDQPYEFQFAYEAGLPTGSANQPAMLLALTMAAQISLNEMLTIPANESSGDVGVVEFSSLEYSEKRKNWKNTAFGSSPRAAKIAQLVDSTIRKARRAVNFGRL